MEFSKLFKYCPVCGSSHFVVNNIKSKRCEKCGFVLYVNPSAATAAFVQNEKNELLVCRRGKEPEKGTLDLPGGFVDGDETAEEAITREVKEELNANVAELQYLFSLPNLYEYSGLTIPTLDMFYSCQLTSYNELIAADDVDSFEFLPLADVKPELFGLKSIRKAVTIFLQENLFLGSQT